jgi:hypothetical protein
MKSAFRARNGKRGPLEVVEGKNTRIPMYDAGEGKVLLAYYAEGRRKLVKCQSLEAGRKRARQIIRISRPAMLTWVTLPPVRPL